MHISDDSNVSDDEFIKKIEKKKPKDVDLEKMTRRQRMAYQAEFGDEQEVFEEELVSLGARKRADDKIQKPKISQREADEKNRVLLHNLLEEQQQKIRDRDKKMKQKEQTI